jgi:hypothetical protein
MSFHTQARRVRRNDLPLHYRLGAFISCVQLYHSLTHQSFTDTCTRFREHYALHKDSFQLEVRLIQAMDDLETERRLFLDQLRLFEKRRIKAKMQGRRTPTKRSVVALYSDIKLVIPNR